MYFISYLSLSLNGLIFRAERFILRILKNCTRNLKGLQRNNFEWPSIQNDMFNSRRYFQSSFWLLTTETRFFWLLTTETGFFCLLTTETRFFCLLTTETRFFWLLTTETRFFWLLTTETRFFCLLTTETRFFCLLTTETGFFWLNHGFTSKSYLRIYDPENNEEKITDFSMFQYRKAEALNWIYCLCLNGRSLKIRHF